MQHNRSCENVLFTHWSEVSGAWARTWTKDNLLCCSSPGPTSILSLINCMQLLNSLISIPRCKAHLATGATSLKPSEYTKSLDRIEVRSQSCHKQTIPDFVLGPDWDHLLTWIQFNSSQQVRCESLVCSVLSDLVFSCLHTLVFLSCHVISRLVLSYPVPSFPSLPGPGERWSLPQGEHLGSHQPPIKSKQNGLRTKMPANTQKNVDCFDKPPPPLDAHTREGVFLCTNTYSHPQRTSMCRNWR